MPSLQWYIAGVVSPRRQRLLAKAVASDLQTLPVCALPDNPSNPTHFNERTCTACGSAVGDLQHVLFQCTHNALVSLRNDTPLPHDMLRLLLWDPAIAPTAWTRISKALTMYPSLTTVSQNAYAHGPSAG